MPDTQTVDEVVSAHPNGAAAPRRVVHETVDQHGTVTIKGAAREDTVKDGGETVGRQFKASTLALFDKLEGKTTPAAGQPAPHEEGDPDEDAPAEGDQPAPHEEGDPDEDAPAEDEAPAEGAEGEEATTEEETTDETPNETEILRADKTRLEQTNRKLVADLEAARKTPAPQRNAREQALVDAEAAYVDKGSVAALRMFLATVVGAAPDSKEVSAELAGMYADLTEEAVGVPLDQSQKAMRDAARARLALARDKRERAESEKKPAPANGGEDQRIPEASRFIDNELATKGTSGTSLADEFPRLMALAEEFDGYKPAELLARAIDQKFKTGALDPTKPAVDSIRAVAQEIEAHYKQVADKIDGLHKKLGTTKGAPTKTPAAAPNKTQGSAKAQGARTISQATASKAPGTAPKTKQKTTTEKTRKDFKSDAEWKNYIFTKHGLAR